MRARSRSKAIRVLPVKLPGYHTLQDTLSFSADLNLSVLGHIEISISRHRVIMSRSINTLSTSLFLLIYIVRL